MFFNFDLLTTYCFQDAILLLMLPEAKMPSLKDGFHSYKYQGKFHKNISCDFDSNVQNF